MNCVRCGKVDITPNTVFIVNHDGEVTAAINAALRAQGIDGEQSLGQLCKACFEVAQACIQEGGRVHAAAHRDLVMQRYEANLGRLLTPAERQEIEVYLGERSGRDSLAPRRGLRPNQQMQLAGRIRVGSRAGAALRCRAAEQRFVQCGLEGLQLICGSLGSMRGIPDGRAESN